MSHSPISSAASLSLVLRHSYVHDTLNLRLINTTVVGGSAPRLEHQSSLIALHNTVVDSGDNQLAIAAQEASLLDDVRGFGFPTQCSGSGGPLIVDIGAAELSSN